MPKCSNVKSVRARVCSHEVQKPYWPHEVIGWTDRNPQSYMSSAGTNHTQSQSKWCSSSGVNSSEMNLIHNQTTVTHTHIYHDNEYSSNEWLHNFNLKTVKNTSFSKKHSRKKHCTNKTNKQSKQTNHSAHESFSTALWLLSNGTISNEGKRKLFLFILCEEKEKETSGSWKMRGKSSAK